MALPRAAAGLSNKESNQTRPQIGDGSFFWCARHDDPQKDRPNPRLGAGLLLVLFDEVQRGAMIMIICRPSTLGNCSTFAFSSIASSTLLRTASPNS